MPQDVFGSPEMPVKLPCESLILDSEQCGTFAASYSRLVSVPPKLPEAPGSSIYPKRLVPLTV